MSTPDPVRPVLQTVNFNERSSLVDPENVIVERKNDGDEREILRSSCLSFAITYPSELSKYRGTGIPAYKVKLSIVQTWFARSKKPKSSPNIPLSAAENKSL